tara:strand:- start:185 stop:3133 length:2949 start_codon:yes stop_codon:yes gene_type:complete
MYGGSGGGGGGSDPLRAYRESLQRDYENFQKVMSLTKPSADNMSAVGVIYQPDKTKWKVTKEKTNFKTDLPIESKINTNFRLKRNERAEEKSTRWGPSYKVYLRFDVVDGNGNVVQEGREEKYSGKKEKTGYGRHSKETGRIIIDLNAEDDIEEDIRDQERQANNTLTIERDKAKIDNEFIEKRNRISNEFNEEGRKLNQKNAAKNAVYDKIVDGIVKNTKGSDYVKRRTKIEDLKTQLKDAGIDSKDANKIISTLKGEYKNFYRTEKLETWNSKLGKKPPYGSFDPSYYAGISDQASNTWENAKQNDDIDITERYVDKNNFMLYHYTSVGKAAGMRGNKAEVTKQANKYLETAPTDQELQTVRDLQLGIGDNQTERLLAVPEIAEQWEAARQGDSYWKKLAKKNYLDIEDPDQFAALFRLSNRDQDKQIKFNINVNADYGITDLEDAVTEAVGEKAAVDAKRFGALTQNVLNDTIKEMKKAKAREQELDLFRGFGGFNEIMTINEELTNSILGDSGVGGVLAFTSGGKAEEDLESALGNVTGVGNNVKYNWENWFENEIKERYKNDLELGYTQGETEKQIAIEKKFAKQYINKYLVPRFDTSRSMDEFVEYLDVRQEEQNPFQTQDMVNAVQQVAELRSQTYLDKLKSADDRSFDADFYFNPTGDDARKDEYKQQAKVVAKDWDEARFGKPKEKAYWASQGYRFGLDINDKESFAKIHFQVKGQGRGYDGAEDILNASKVRDKIYDDILPLLKEEALKQGTIFGQFIKPEEFAEDILEGVDPTDNEKIDEILEEIGLEDFSGTIEELKEYIADAVRTGSAREIREGIKYLNEKRKKPTQENLGITYIEREEDADPDKVQAETELYKVFSNAGYKGTEDEFYENFFPDTDRSEQILLSKSGRDDALKTTGLDFSDPYTALGTVQSFFDEDEREEREREQAEEGNEKREKSYFSLNLDDEDEDYKSKSGQEILGEFTSMFKGF